MGCLCKQSSGRRLQGSTNELTATRTGPLKTTSTIGRRLLWTADGDASTVAAVTADSVGDLDDDADAVIAPRTLANPLGRRLLKGGSYASGGRSSTAYSGRWGGASRSRTTSHVRYTRGSSCVSTTTYTCGRENSYRVGSRTIIIGSYRPLGYYYGIDAVLANRAIYNLIQPHLLYTPTADPWPTPQPRLAYPGYYPTTYSFTGSFTMPYNLSRYEVLSGVHVPEELPAEVLGFPALSDKQRWPLTLTVHDLTLFVPNRKMGPTGWETVGTMNSNGWLNNMNYATIGRGANVYFTFYGPPLWPAGLGPAELMLIISAVLFVSSCCTLLWVSKCLQGGLFARISPWLRGCGTLYFFLYAMALVIWAPLALVGAF